MAAQGIGDVNRFAGKGRRKSKGLSGECGKNF